MAKQLTYDQVADRKDRAERFVRDVRGDDDRGDEIADEPVESYAARRHFDIVDNSRRVSTMANGQSKADLLDQIADLQDENDALSAQLDAIQDILSGFEDGGDDDGDDGGDDYQD